jgi:glycosyltransferase involved in cell wall biosynthesis
MEDNRFFNCEAQNVLSPTQNSLAILVVVLAHESCPSARAWLEAWQNADKYGSQLMVIHNFTNSTRPDNGTVDAILQYKPDFYLQRTGGCVGVGALEEVLAGNGFGDWNILAWFSSKTIVISKDFLLPFIAPFVKDSKVGVVGSYVPGEGAIGKGLASAAFSIRREVANQLKFSSQPEADDSRCFNSTMHDQVITAGFAMAEAEAEDKLIQPTKLWPQAGKMSPGKKKAEYPISIWSHYNRQFDVPLTIITPWKDRADLIPDYERVVNGAQVIIIDNASSPKAAAAIKGMVFRLRGKLIVNATNKWFAYANNQGLKLADGHIVCFLNSDMRGNARWLDHVISEVRDGGLYGPSLAPTNVLGIDLPFLGGWCVAATRSTWARLGGWDAERFPLPYWEDNDLSLRAIAKGIRLFRTGWSVEHISNATSTLVQGAYNGAQSNFDMFQSSVRSLIQTGAIRNFDRTIYSVSEREFDDVTDTVKLLQLESSARLIVNNQMFGNDPAPGKKKMLQIQYRTDAVDHEHLHAEGDTLILKAGSEIINALYGCDLASTAHLNQQNEFDQRQIECSENPNLILPVCAPSSVQPSSVGYSVSERIRHVRMPTIK